MAWQHGQCFRCLSSAVGGAPRNSPTTGGASIAIN